MLADYVWELIFGMPQILFIVGGLVGIAAIILTKAQKARFVGRYSARHRRKILALKEAGLPPELPRRRHRRLDGDLERPPTNRRLTLHHGW